MRGRGKPDRRDVGSLLRDAFDDVSVATMRRAVMTEALEDANLIALPERVEELTFFVSGPLYERAQQLMGSDFADSLLRAFAPILDEAWERDRARSSVPVSSVRTAGSVESLPGKRRSSVWKVLDDDAVPESGRDTVPSPAPSARDSSRN